MPETGNIWLRRLCDHWHLLFSDLADCNQQTSLPKCRTTTILPTSTSYYAACNNALLPGVVTGSFFENEPLKIRLILMGWTNKHTAAYKKYTCVQQVKYVAGSQP